MTISRFSARALTESVRIVGDARPNFLKDFVFSPGSMHPTDVIDFGKMQVVARVATYQRPGGPAIVVNKSMADAKTVHAPKIREKIVFDENFAEVLNAALPGYKGPFGTDRNAQIPAKVATEQQKLRNRIERAIELQCAQALTTGTITLTFADGTTATISLEFTGDGATTGNTLTIQPDLSGTEMFTASGSDPLGYIESRGDQIRDNSDYNGPLNVILGSSAWAAFRKNKAIMAQLDNRRVESGTLKTSFDAAFKGSIDGFNFYKYVNGYVNSSGTRVQAWPGGIMVIMPPQDAGKTTIEYGAVYDRPSKDEQARYIQTDYFSKMIAEGEDPPVDELIVESRPLALIKDPSAIRVCQVCAN